MNEYSKSITIDLVDMIKFVCKKWFIVVIVSFVCMFAFVGYQIKRNDTYNKKSQMEENINLDDEELLLSKCLSGSSLSEDQKDAVRNAIAIGKSIDLTKEKMDQWIVARQKLKNKPLACVRYVLIVDSDINNIDNVVSSSIETYVTSGGMKNSIVEKNKEGEKVFEDVFFSATSVLSDSQNIYVDNETGKKATTVCFYFDGENEESTEKALQLIDEELRTYLLGYDGICTIDVEMDDKYYCADYVDAIPNKYKYLQDRYEIENRQFVNYTELFSDEQKAIVNCVLKRSALGLQDINVANRLQTSISTMKRDPREGVIKYGVMGFVVGTILTFGVISMIYIFSDTIKTEDDISVLGNIKCVNSRLENESIIIKNICSICSVNQIKKICLGATGALEHINGLDDELKKMGIETVESAHILQDEKAFAQMIETGSLLLIEKRKHSRKSDFVQVCDVCSTSNVNIIGCILL